MSPDDVTYWIGQLKAGNPAAAGPLWTRYFENLVRLARPRLWPATRRAVGGEDVAQSAFGSFCRAVREGRLPRLTDRDSLWSHMFNYLRRKASYANKREYAEIRGGGKVVNASALDGPDGEPFEAEILGRDPTPEMVAHFAELFERLPTEELRSVAQWKLAGFTNEQIAAELGCSTKTVERKLGLIRGLWNAEGRS